MVTGQREFGIGRLSKSINATATSKPYQFAFELCNAGDLCGTCVLCSVRWVELSHPGARVATAGRTVSQCCVYVGVPGACNAYGMCG